MEFCLPDLKMSGSAEASPFDDFLAFFSSPTKAAEPAPQPGPLEKGCDVGDLWNTIVCMPPMVSPGDDSASPFGKPTREEAAAEAIRRRNAKPARVKKTLDEEYEDWLKQQNKDGFTPSSTSSSAAPVLPPTLPPVLLSEQPKRRLTSAEEEEVRKRDEQLQKLRDEARQSREREEAALKALLAEREKAAQALANEQAMRAKAEEEERLAQKLKEEAAARDLAEREAALAERKRLE